MSRLVLVLVVLAAKTASCAFFDLTDVDDPLSLLWHTKGTTDATKSTECTVTAPDGTSITGLCKHKTLCLLSGGQINRPSSCGILSTCCTQPTESSQRTRAKVSYFTSGQDFQPDRQFTVEALNDNICQMRLDFEQFELSPAVERSGPTNTLYTTVCSVDYMIVTPDNYNVSRPFCGNNNGQHVYVHLHSQRTVTLHVRLHNTATSQDNVVARPQWRIKITQLECPGPLNFFTRHKNFNAENDFNLLAPEGALQYFTAPSGRIRSFGYASSSYISGLGYGIAFKRTPYVNCIRFAVSYMRLRNNLATPPICQDYLFVPELQTDINGVDGVYGSRLCSRKGSPVNKIFYLPAPAPFYIHFVSASLYTDSTDNLHGFDIQYDLTTCN
ncbi:unnamed protein product [Tenebrio molitor]|nr:unnamed protein product [Tenebrio molitor]